MEREDEERLIMGVCEEERKKERMRKRFTRRDDNSIPGREEVMPHNI